MNKRALLIVSMVAFLATAVIVATSNAKDDFGGSSGSTAMKSPVSQQAEQSGEFTGARHSRHSLEAMMKKLGITDEQKKQIRNLYVEFRDRTRKTRMELKSLRDEKKTMLLSGKIDQQKLAQIDDKVVTLVSDLLKERLKLRRDRLALMTPEQIDRIADWQAQKEFRSKMHKGMKWGRMHFGHRRGEFCG
jgi:Spy/CpxP family protein refolding chaperone